jgi:hypothetical protein
VAVSDFQDTNDPLARATQLLRQHTDAGWTVMSANILARALRAFRPSNPVRGRHDHGDFFIASDVLVARVREAVDAVPQAAATKITCTTNQRRELDRVTIQIVAAYGAHLVTLGEHLHAATVATLTDLLGDLAPDRAEVHTHVHVGDVSDDPRDVLR